MHLVEATGPICRNHRIEFGLAGLAAGSGRRVPAHGGSLDAPQAFFCDRVAGLLLEDRPVKAHGEVDVAFLRGFLGARKCLVNR